MDVGTGTGTSGSVSVCAPCVYVAHLMGAGRLGMTTLPGNRDCAVAFVDRSRRLLPGADTLALSRFVPGIPPRPMYCVLVLWLV